jgi:acyl-ACP thioesterase
MMMETKGEYAFRVRTYECGENGLATLPAICNYLQEAAALNAEELSFSRSNFAAAGDNMSWVLSRLRVQMASYPRWNETVTVLTFPRGGRRITAWRDFILTGDDGRPLGVATSEWMLIDLATRKVLPIPEAVYAAANTVRAPVLGVEPYTPRLRFPAAADTPPALAFRAQQSQIDLNGHVNNVHYVAWALEAVPAAFRGRRVAALDIVFRQEAKAGDALVSSVEIVSPDRLRHAIARPSDGALLATAETRWRDATPSQSEKR